jgi:hypothetical protein
MLFTPTSGYMEIGLPFVEILTSRAAAKDLLVSGKIDVFDRCSWTLPP